MVSVKVTRHLRVVVPCGAEVVVEAVVEARLTTVAVPMEEVVIVIVIEVLVKKETLVISVHISLLFFSVRVHSNRKPQQLIDARSVFFLVSFFQPQFQSELDYHFQ